MKEPINIFKSDEELQQSLKEWQERLFLTDWVIKAEITNELSSKGLHGHNDLKYSIKAAMIRINQETEVDGDDWIMRQPQELVLVHELLHCKMALLTNSNPTYEQYALEIAEHQLLEEMAKSLIMAKYNLTFDYFKK